MSRTHVNEGYLAISGAAWNLSVSILTYIHIYTHTSVSYSMTCLETCHFQDPSLEHTHTHTHTRTHTHTHLEMRDKFQTQLRKHKLPLRIIWEYRSSTSIDLSQHFFRWRVTDRGGKYRLILLERNFLAGRHFIHHESMLVVCVSLLLFVCSIFCLILCLIVCLVVCLFVWFVCLFVCLIVCLFVCMLVCFSTPWCLPRCYCSMCGRMCLGHATANIWILLYLQLCAFFVAGPCAPVFALVYHHSWQ